MCQAKDKGGKRCLAHSSVTKFVKRMVTVKTGASEQLVNETVKELSKEGKKLEAPKNSEVANWLDTKRFATEIDPDLNEHERKIQLNQIDRAQEEVKQGVTGGAWHTWKNLRKRVIEKMKNARKTVLAIGLTGALAFGMGGCFSTAPDSNGTIKPPTTTSAPAVDNVTYGDLITMKDANGKPVTVNDEFGDYTRITINPKDDSMRLNADTLDPSVRQAGWNTKDVLAGQQWVSTFVAEEGIDSGAVDTPNGWEAWKTTTANEKIAPEWVDAVVNSPTDGGDRSSVILNNNNSSFPVLTRDGSTRIDKSKVTVTKVSGATLDDGTPILVVSGVANTKYRTTNENIINAFMKVNPEATREQIIDLYPAFAKEGDSKFDTTFNFLYGIRQDGNGGWLLTGFKNTSASNFDK